MCPCMCPCRGRGPWLCPGRRRVYVYARRDAAPACRPTRTPVAEAAAASLLDAHPQQQQVALALASAQPLQVLERLLGEADSLLRGDGRGRRSACGQQGRVRALRQESTGARCKVCLSCPRAAACARGCPGVAPQRAFRGLPYRGPRQTSSGLWWVPASSGFHARQEQDAGAAAADSATASPLGAPDAGAVGRWHRCTLHAPVQVPPAPAIDKAGAPTAVEVHMYLYREYKAWVYSSETPRSTAPVPQPSHPPLPRRANLTR